MPASSDGHLALWGQVPPARRDVWCLFPQRMEKPRVQGALTRGSSDLLPSPGCASERVLAGHGLGVWGGGEGRCHSGAMCPA